MFEITTARNIHMQVDGEPWLMCPSSIRITHLNQASMLFNSYHHSTPHKSIKKLKHLNGQRLKSADRNEKFSTSST